MIKDEPASTPKKRAKRVPLLSNGRPEVFMADWIKRGPAGIRVGSPAEDPQKNKPAASKDVPSLAADS